MIKANVGRSQKVSRDYQSQGFSVNLEGEITAPVSDPEAVVEQIKEPYDLADEALRQQVERHQSIDTIASRDEERAPANPPAPERPAPPPQPRPQPTNNNYPPRSGGGRPCREWQSDQTLPAPEGRTPLPVLGGDDAP